MKKVLFFVVLPWLFNACDTPQTAKRKQQGVLNTKDSLLLEQIKTARTPTEAFGLATQLEADALRLKQLKSITWKVMRDSALFSKLNIRLTQEAIKVKDTFHLAESFRYRAIFFNRSNVVDSSYWLFDKAYKLYEVLGDDFNKGRMLYNMAFLKGHFKDYTGSEVFTIRAVKLLEGQNRPQLLFSCYINLSNIYVELEEYGLALEYNQKAMDLAESLKQGKAIQQGVLNNLGALYLRQEEYAEALSYFDRVLQQVPQLKKQAPTLYAQVLDNRTYIRMQLGDTLGAFKEFKRALLLREARQDTKGIIINRLHLAEYHTLGGDTLRAIESAQVAKVQSLATRDYEQYLNALKVLADIDRPNAKAYLKTHVRFNDSLLKVERKQREKFTRIDFETDQYIAEAEQLLSERRLLSVLLLLVFVVVGLAVVVYTQRIQNKKLYFKQRQQEIDEEVYLLSMERQTQVEQATRKEQKRISEELHDGVLGKLFAVRIGMGFLKPTSKKAKQEEYIKELENIEEEIRTISHNLKSELGSEFENFHQLLRKLIGQKAKIGGFTYFLNMDESIAWDELVTAERLNVVRILQEIFQNIIKHSEAEHAVLSFWKKETSIHMFVRDDGVGFDVRSKKKGIGLSNLHSRTKQLKGKLEIFSNPGKGTTILIEFPNLQKNNESLMERFRKSM